MTNVKAQPAEYHTVTPYMYIKGAAAAIEFYKKAFGAEEQMRFPGPGGTVGHAELKIGDSVIMLADMPDKSPQTLGKTTVSLLVYVEDVDSAFQKAISAGAKELQPLEDKFYGDRSGMLADPFGHEWSLSTHIEDLTVEEMQHRMAAMPAMSS